MQHNKATTDRVDFSRSPQALPEPNCPRKTIKTGYPKRNHPHVDDNHSVGTISTSYSKAHSATFSAPNLDFHMYSPSATTPTISRAQSPTRMTSAPHQAMELDLAGIGDCVKALPSDKFVADLPILVRNTDLSGRHVPSDRDEATELSSLTEAPVGFQESDSDSDMAHSYLDLEKAASIALSRCFGCAGILEEDESFSAIDWDDDGFSCYDVEEGEINSGNSACGETSNQAQPIETRAKKRPAGDQGGDDDFDDVGNSPGRGQGPTKRERNKRRRIGCPEEFSCPFRKRNPRRFNVRDFDACANLSFRDMTSLKRHVSLQHGNGSCQYCQQPRTAGEDHPPNVCLRNQQMETYLHRQDPEAGVSKRVDDILKSRTAGSKIKKWSELWHLIFPEDEVVPSPHFEPLIEHHDVADEGCNEFVVETAQDITGFLSKHLDLSWQSLKEIIHKRTRTLLKGSKYAVYDRYELTECHHMPLNPSYNPMPKGRCVGSAVHDINSTASDDGVSPVIIVTPQTSPPEADAISNNKPTGLKPSSSVRPLIGSI
ncbi:uncharacterized protein CTRU02_204447 [Colletotrichum truncatum]|uniref:Uncharacterized protein n=1 Tax=Colletotrichum truncatum TaxID=5467 RepID=A0ACC3ZC35_COLTU